MARLSDTVILRLVKECRMLTEKCRESILTQEDLDRLDNAACTVEQRIITNAKDVLRRTQNATEQARAGSASPGSAGCASDLEATR